MAPFRRDTGPGWSPMPAVRRVDWKWWLLLLGIGLFYLYRWIKDRPHLADRTGLILALGAVLAVLLTAYRRRGPRDLLRELGELAVAMALAALLVAPPASTTHTTHHPVHRPAARPAQAQPIKVPDLLGKARQWAAEHPFRWPLQFEPVSTKKGDR